MFLAAALPGLDPGLVRFVPHHVAHAASAGLAAPLVDGAHSSACLVLDGRGEHASHLSGHYVDGRLEVLAAQPKHADAAAEVRVIEARMAQAAAKESGVFGRKR